LQVEDARERLEDLLDANGYSAARVRTRLVGPPGEARAVFIIEEGPRQTVDKVVVHGREFTAGRVIRREIPIAPGDPISRTGLLKIQRELYALGVFRAVDVRTVPRPDDPSRADVIVEVVEGDPLLTAVGLGWDTTERLQAFAQIGHNNVFGTGRSVSLLHRRSSINKRAQVSLSDRRLFGIPFEGIASASYDKFQRESFQERRRGVGVQFMHKLKPEITVLGRYSLEDVRLSDVELQEDTDLTVEEIRLGSIGGSIARDTRDDILSPTRGRFASIDYRLYAKTLGSGPQFNRLFLSTATFHTLKRNLVVGASARIGFAPPFGSTGVVPLSQRFFAGGDTTLRGFLADEAGPVQFPANPNDDDPSYDPVGGQLSVILNAELRFPVWRSLGGVLFYDAGNVFVSASEFRFSGSETIVDDDLGCVIQDGFRHVLGAGLRIDTPLGPIRLEYGRKLDRRRDSYTFLAADCDPGFPSVPVERLRRESPYELFLSVGHAF
jgi:outer membrane protein insertion porin family